IFRNIKPITFNFFYRSSWRTWMGADSCDSVLSIGRYRSGSDDDSSPLSKNSSIFLFDLLQDKKCRWQR
ncbi:hypothetical protein DBV15_01087, partial [Temnothorax longispinosus]